MSLLCCSHWWTARAKHHVDEGNHALNNHPKSVESSSTSSEAEIKSSYLLSVDTATFSPTQCLLRVHQTNAGFNLHDHESLPEINSEDEVLLKVIAVGLNPIDWKAPKFGWGLPSLPCVLGRDMVGVIVQLPKHLTSSAQHHPDLEIGSIVGAISTDYRDYRKAAFQQYAVASTHNVYRIPSSFDQPLNYLASIGVAFVTAALTLGVCLGVRLSRPSRSETPLDLLELVRNSSAQFLPVDVYDECFSILEEDRLSRDQWLVIWGAGTTVGLFLTQLAKLAGLKLVCVADATKSGPQLVDMGVDMLVHRHNTAEAINIIRSMTRSRQIHHAVDVVGKESAGQLQGLLTKGSSRGRHLVGIVGSPAEKVEGVVNHKVPVKLFHEVPILGAALMQLLEDLLASGNLKLPDVHVTQDTGLQAVPSALRLLEEGSFEGQRIVVPV